MLTWGTVAQKTISTQRSVVKDHGFGTEGGGKEGGFNTRGSGKEGQVSIRRVVLQRMVQEVA